MLAQGAKEIHKLTKVDAGKTAEEIEDIYNSWQSALLKKLCEIHPLTKMGKSSLATPYEAALVEIPNFHWEIEAEKHKNVLKEFSNYSSTVKCKVIHLKELRKSVADGRSTLWVRIKNEKIQVTPACNINIFPLNSVAVTPQDCLIVQFKENRGKVPFPPMPFR